MYEDITADILKQRILSRLPADDSRDEDSPLYIITGPIAQETVDTTLKEVSFGIEQSNPLTANRYYLEQFARLYNIYPNPATPSQVEGEFDIELEIGTRFSKDQVNFYVSEFLRYEDGYYYYILTCEQVGEVGNVAPGNIIAIYFIKNLQHAVITRLLVPGEEVEDTEVFRARFLASFRSKRFCGNISDYFDELAEAEAVGKFKVLRCRNYKGEVDPEWVTVIFTDTLYKRPSDEQISQLQEYFQPLDPDTKLPSHTTSGVGLAPIGQLCWVEGVKNKQIDFGLNLTFEAEYNWDNCEAVIREALEQRLTQYVIDQWGDTVLTNKSYNPMEYYILIRRSEIESLLIGIEGILDSTSIKINGEFANFALSWDEIPLLGDVYLHTESDTPQTGDCPYNCPDCQCNYCKDRCGRLLDG